MIEGQAKLVVADKSHVADGVVSLTLRHPDGDPLPGWDPGAHIDVHLAAGMTRQYSLCGDPLERRYYRIAVLREAAGRGGSAYVHDRLQAGSHIAIGLPRNHFALVPADRYLFIVGGIGITPILPMVAAAQAAGAQWRLIYGGRTRDSMAFLDELARYGDKVTLVPQDEQGHIDLERCLSTLAIDTRVYCCGRESLLAAVESSLRPHAGRLHMERFAPKSTRDTGSDTEFEVELARTGASFTVPPSITVLEAVEKVGVSVPSSCREGTCGTCETSVLAGTPDHRDSLLTDDEHATGALMLICVSRSLTPKLVLDL
ncbi:oxidoreductase [Mycobacterium sp. OAE908]|uniref:PDR/VanB family oxidoreductase n=1 Tax=Mycobacterium sp. OAE908 TaxID=2817899 RepID=UPI001AE72BAD